MDNKIIGELLTLVRKAKLSDKDKKTYIAHIKLGEERMRRASQDDPRAMDKLVENYNKKKEIVKNKDKAAWDKLVEEEVKELEALVAKEK